VRIACVFEDGTVNARYRALLPLQALAARGHSVVWPRVASVTLRAYDVPSCDVVLMHRCFYPPHVELVQRLRERRIAVVWDNDDDFSSLPKLSRLGTRRSRREHKQDFERSIEVARLADLVTTPSARIAELYGAHGALTEVIENAVPAAQTGRDRRRHRGLVIGYTGAREHLDDIKRLRIAAALERVMRRHAGVRVVSIGVPLDIKLPGYTDHGQVDVDRMMAIEREFDIAIAPLVDTPFNCARSNIKLKEYAAAGAMWLASPVGPYRDLGAEQGGILVDDHDWEEALSRLVDDEPTRAALTAGAQAWAKRETLERIAGRWEAAMRRAVRSARAGTAVAPV
jgi:glycosyltransferase involved in cell wall biosynthesis